VKKQLADRGLMPEEWGGKTVFVDVSAKKKTNLNLLMEMICLVADLGELKLLPSAPRLEWCSKPSWIVGAARWHRVGTERNPERRRQFCGWHVYGKVRAMFDDRGAPLKTAPPSTPVEIIGMEALPQAGDQFVWWPIATRRAAFPNTANRNRARRRWPRVRAYRWKDWRSRSRPQAPRN